MKDGHSFHINESMVQRFSRLTGDLNPLHTDGEFARRTPYRRPIAQGMMIYGYIVFLTKLLRKGDICIPIHMKAQFMEPVFIDQRLCLEIEPTNIDPLSDTAAVDFVVKRMNDSIVTLKGHIKVRYIKSKLKKDQGVEESDANGMAIGRIPLNSLQLEDISVGDTEKFRFNISGKNNDEYIDILRNGLVDPAGADIDRLKKDFHIPNLLAAMMLSTSVGMFYPGKFATFLDFDLNLSKALPQDREFHLKGIVQSVSASTRMIKKDIVVMAGAAGIEEALSRGHVHALINHPPAAIPDIREMQHSSKDLGMAGKVALVTGSSRGIGESIAKLLAVQGVKVAINYYKGMHDAKRIVREIEENGGKAVAIGADVRSEEQVRRMIEKVNKTLGNIDILVNNAVRDFKPSSFERTSWKDVAEDIDVIVQGAFNCCKAVLPAMVSKKSGKIINIGTVATENPPANQAKYVIAKSALVGMTRALSIEYAPKNVQVNMVTPHFVDTDLIAHIPVPYRKKMEREIPMKRAASTIDIAKTVVFLASTYSDFVTGQKVMVTGGGAPYA